MDGGPVSLAAIPVLRRFVRRVDARVTLVHVLDGPPLPRWQIPGEPFAEAERQLRSELLPVETVVRTGEPAGEILAVCREQEADLLVMSTHGRSGPARWILGSVTESVLRHATLPMLVVPASGVRTAAGVPGEIGGTSLA